MINYSAYLGVYLRPETMKKLKEISRLRYEYHEQDAAGKDLKQPKSNVAKLVREILENYVEKLDKK